MFNVQTVECFDTFKEEWRRVASMDIGRILPGIAILSGQVAFMMSVLMAVDGNKLPGLELHLYLFFIINYTFSVS